MYVEGFVTAVPIERKPEYIELAKQIVPIFKKYGAVRVADCLQDNVPHGSVTDFFRAVQAKEDEAVVLSWIEYPSKSVRDEAMEKMKTDPEMQKLQMPFDEKRMIVGGFESIMDTSETA